MNYQHATPRRGGTTTEFKLLLALLAFSTLNVATLISRILGRNYPLNPIVFTFVAAVVYATWRKRGSFVWPSYLRYSFLFLVLYTVGGFLPMLVAGYRSTEWEIYDYMQEILKPIIALFGIPALALAVTPRNGVRLVGRTYIYCVLVGTSCAVVQLWIPEFLLDVANNSEGRGSGIWVNPNNCALLGNVAIIASFIFPFESRSISVGVRAILVCGIVSTLSKSGISGLLIVLGVIGSQNITNPKYLAVSLVLGAFLIVAVQHLDMVVPSKSVHRSRVDALIGITSGDVGAAAEASSGRAYLANYAFEQIRRKGPFIGLGHGAMDGIVPVHNGLVRMGPHNTYLYIWGNSGAAALIAFVVLGMQVFHSSVRISCSMIRAALCAVCILIAFYAYFAHDVIGSQSHAGCFTLIALVTYHARRK